MVSRQESVTTVQYFVPDIFNADKENEIGYF